MSNALPERPDLRHLRAQAKDILDAGGARSLADAQFQIARQYGFGSWPKLKAHVEAMADTGELKQAIDANDLSAVQVLMTRNPKLHHAAMGYGNNGPLTWVAECRVPWEPPSAVRLEMARWMIENGSDVHQGGDGPLMRAALNADRLTMMELLVANGANVNAKWNANFPILFAACEAVNPVSLRWLLEHGANPHCGALDYAIAGYWRSEKLTACIDLLIAAGATTKYDAPGVLDILRGRVDHLDASLAHRRYPEMDFGSSGGRRLLLTGGTLLHLAAEYGNVEAARMLLDHGADVNARDGSGAPPIFHSVTQFQDWGLAVTELLIERGADLGVRATLPGHYEKPDEFVECTPLGYAVRYPGDDFPGANAKTIQLLRDRGAPE